MMLRLHQEIRSYVYFYAQDRFELSDLVINLGLRFDYFDSKADILKDEKLPYAYGNPDIFDDADFVIKKAEFYVSPRIGLGFPVTSTTVFHAQFGKFIQSLLCKMYLRLKCANWIDKRWKFWSKHRKFE